MAFQPVILWSDALTYLLVILVIAFVFWASTRQDWCASWRQVSKNGVAMLSLFILLCYVSIALLDSLHFREKLPGGGQHYSTQVKSLLDVIISPLGVHEEKSYSAPFALEDYNKTTVVSKTGAVSRVHPKLKYAGQHLTGTRTADLSKRVILALIEAALVWTFINLVIAMRYSIKNKRSLKHSLAQIWKAKTHVPWRFLFIGIAIVLFLFFLSLDTASYYHVFGTDKVGRDVFYEAIKSIRTGLLLGTLTTLIMLPFAIFMGTMAGYFGGIIDDLIQYIYTTLSSIPGVLLIAASILALQIYMANHATTFATPLQRADVRLLALCAILGVTSWTSLCRMLRGETLKLREMEYIQAAKVLGVKDIKIIVRHIIPNIMHIILIAIALDFSGLVLAEAVLSYVGVGVDPTMASWGNMINAARLELAREPVVWWPILAAFVFMFILVLAANLFADGIRDAFDPRIRSEMT